MNATLWKIVQYLNAKNAKNAKERKGFAKEFHHIFANLCESPRTLRLNTKLSNGSRFQ